jgi:hypothetical protein
MKAWVTFLLLTCFGLNYTYGQPKKKIYVPVLKENKLLDSLLDLMFHYEGLPAIGNEKLSHSNYIILNISNMVVDNSYYFHLYTGADEKSINCSINNLVNNGTAVGCGYLTYKKYKIFVWTNKNYEFFKQKSRAKTFKFLYKVNCDDYLPNITHLSLLNYKYKNGIFSIDTLPPMR